MTGTPDSDGRNPPRVLTATSLYPNAVMPNHGIFVENRMRHLQEDGQVSVRVIAPVPWFPFTGARFGRFGAFAAVPHSETRAAIDILHPRYFTAPKIGSWTTPYAILHAYLRAAKRLTAAGKDFDVVDGHYFYPDGVAAVMLAKRLGKPVVVSARGSDLTYLPRSAYPRRWIQWAIREADAIVTVSDSLRREAIALGAPGAKVRTLRNGVNLQEFQPVARAEARRFAGVPDDASVVASVGNLIPLKGHDLVLEALSGLPGVHLVVVGGGAEESRLRAVSGSLGLNDRVHFLGRVPHDRMAAVYSAADVLVLASSREGWPNVLLEAMACGTPAIATRVGGVPEIITEPESGRILTERTGDAIAQALALLLDTPPDRAATRAYAEKFDWSETVRGLVDVYRSVITDRTASS